MDNSPRILIVDDNEINRDTLEGLCESLGLSPILATNGSEALQMIRLHPQPDLVLLDLIMPEINGYQVLKEIKSDKHMASIPVIMISVVDEMESIVQCIEAGADDYLVKPFNALLLKARINASLARKKLADQEKRFNLWLADSYQKLQKAEESRDTLFQMVVHDLNNPLTTIVGTLDLLGIRTANPPITLQDCAADLAAIKEAARTVQSLISQILDISSIEEGKMPLNFSQVDLADLVREVCRQFRTSVEQTGGSIDCDIQTDIVLSHVDRNLLSRILQNLIVNAIKHTQVLRPPKITVGLEREGDVHVLWVQDNGPGIAAGMQEKIFEKFFQIHSGEERKVKGLGLGLTFCKMAVMSMGGTIAIDSETGQGARFLISLPAEKTAGQQ